MSFDVGTYLHKAAMLLENAPPANTKNDGKGNKLTLDSKCFGPLQL